MDLIQLGEDEPKPPLSSLEIAEANALAALDKDDKGDADVSDKQIHVDEADLGFGDTSRNIYSTDPDDKQDQDEDDDLDLGTSLQNTFTGRRRRQEASAMTNSAK